MNATLKVLSGFIVGALAGITTGILLAPTSGDKTRKKIIKEFSKVKNDLSYDVEEKFGHLKEEYNEKLGHLTELGKKSIEKLRDKVSAN